MLRPRHFFVYNVCSLIRDDDPLRRTAQRKEESRVLNFIPSPPPPRAKRLRRAAVFRDAKSEMHAGPKEAKNRRADAKVHYFIYPAPSA